MKDSIETPVLNRETARPARITRKRKPKRKAKRRVQLIEEVVVPVGRNLKPAVHMPLLSELLSESPRISDALARIAMAAEEIEASRSHTVVLNASHLPDESAD